MHAFIGKPKGKRSLERTRHSWEHNVNMAVEMEQEGAVTGFIWFSVLA